MPSRPTSWPLSEHEQPTLRLRDPAGVVAAVPYLLGFVPRRSLVVVGVDDHQGVGATLRTDLPTADLLGSSTSSGLLAAWDRSVQVLGRNGCTQGLVVLYSDVDPADLPPGAAGRLLALLDPGADALLAAGGPAPDRRGPREPDDRDVEPDRPRRAGAPERPASLDVLDVLLVGPTRFRSLGCPDGAPCCPAGGFPVEATGSHPVAASFVLAGRSAVASREVLEPPPPAADPVEAAAATAATVRHRLLVRRVRGRDRGRDAALLDEWLACLPGGPSPGLAGRLASGWRSSPLLRDACLAAFLPGGAPLARSLLGPGPSDGSSGRSSDGSSGPSDEHVADPAAPSLSGALDDPSCAVAVRDGAPVLRRMAALVPAPESADVLAAHAWLAWASGEGTAAAVLAERALAVDGAQSLARLVLRCLDHGLGAPWTSRSHGTAGGTASGR